MNVRVFNIYLPLRNLIFFIIEASLIFIAILIASVVKIELLDGLPVAWGATLSRIALVTFVCVMSLYYHNLYHFEQTRDFKDLIIRLLQTLGVACVILAVIYALFPEFIIAERVFMLALLIIVSVVLSWRLFYTWALKSQRLTEKVLLLGKNKFARTIVDEIEKRQDTGFHVVGLLTDTDAFVSADSSLPVLGQVTDVKEVVAQAPCDRIVVTLAEQRGQLPLTQLLELKLKGKQVNDAVEFYEHLTGKIMVERLRPSYFIFSDGFKLGKSRLWFKRITDILFSLFGLALFLPVSILIAIGIKLESKGPVFYRQERVGQGGKTFVLYKFRSMRAQAELDKPVWADVDDKRTTWLGGVIRKLRFDEIPQMLNVLKGDMSVVGPRPERPYFVDQLKEKIPYYLQRHAVKPGMTGWAQIRFRYGASVDDALEKLKHDLYYIKNLSLLLDMAIVFETTKLILLRKGAR